LKNDRIKYSRNGIPGRDLENDLRDRLRGIYSETTIDHILQPHNTDSIPNPDGFAACGSGCGENMKIWLRAKDNIILEAAFWTDGCAATIACGSMCTDLVKDKSAAAALAITARDIAEALIDLPEGNLHCAELAASALRLALKDLLSVQQQPWKKLYRK
jgi:nitrogen fixation protein NifU and related proteins